MSPAKFLGELAIADQQLTGWGSDLRSEIMLSYFLRQQLIHKFLV